MRAKINSWHVASLVQVYRQTWKAVGQRAAYVLALFAEVQMIEALVVIAKYGDDYIDACLESLGDKYPIKVMDTTAGGHPTGAYLRAYKQYPAESYFFMQDSMIALQKDYLEPFRKLMPDEGAVAWAYFDMKFDDNEQRELFDRHYSGELAKRGIFGPIFYTNRKSLDKLERLGLLPPIPINKIEAQGTERMWAQAFKNADMEVRAFQNRNREKMRRGSFPVFRKVFGGRD